jgi:hypothetical protein
MANKKKTFPRVLDRAKPKEVCVRLATFSDAQTEEDAIQIARRINDRVRLERKEFKARAKDAYLAALLPRG